MKSHMLDQRQKKIRDLIARRQIHFTVILENVSDPHNIGAVLRSCDAVGIHEIFLIYTDPKYSSRFTLGKRASSGARKWVDVFQFDNIPEAIQSIRLKGYDQIWATRIVPGSKNLYEMDLTGNIALLFGNEHLGVSEEAATHADGNFIIPQVGMVQSLNISVACAVALYEGFRQRRLKGYYDGHSMFNAVEQEAMFNRYAERELIRHKGRSAIKSKPEK